MYLCACWWFCQTLASRHQPADKTHTHTHTQKRRMRHSKPLPSMRLYCEALKKQRGAADGGVEREEGKRWTERNRRKTIWMEEKERGEMKRDFEYLKAP